MIEEAILAINAAAIPRTSKANGLALLALANHENGHVWLTWSDLARVFNGVSGAVVRRHLGYLQGAQIIHYSSNGDGVVYINFKSWLHESRVGATKNARGRAKNVDPTRDLGSDLTRAPAGALVGWLIDPDLDPDHNQPTNHGPDADAATADPLQPDALQLPAPDAADQARTVALLVDKAVGVSLARSRQLAAAHTFDFCRRVVAMYWDQLQSGAVKAGKVITAIDADYGAPEIPDAFRRTEFYHRHRTPAEIAEEEAPPRYEPTPPAEDDTPPPSPYPLDHPAWLALNGDPLAADLVGLAGVDQVDGVVLYRFAAKDGAKVSWLDQRIGTKLRKVLKARLGSDCLVEIVGPLEVT